MTIFDKTYYTLDLANDTFIVEKLNQGFSERKPFGKVDGIVNDGWDACPDQGCFVNANGTFATECS